MFAGTGCYQTVHFNMPPGDADASDDAAAHDGQDIQDHDAVPETPDAVEAADGGDLIHDPHPDDGPQDDVAVDAADAVDGEDAVAEDVVADAADVEEEETFEPYPAGDFTLTDYNADSSTYLQERELSTATGKVIVLFFLSYG